MKVLNLDKNILNIQKCYLPYSDFVKNYFGLFAILRQPDELSECIVKIGLCKHKNLHDACYVDTSVSKFLSPKISKKRNDISRITTDNLRVMPSAEKCKSVNVTIVFDEVFDIKKFVHKQDLLKSIVRDILKLFIFTVDSIIFLDNLPKSQRLNLYCIIVNSVNNSSDTGLIHQVTGGTSLVINESISKLKFKQQRKSNNIYLGGCENTYKIIREMIEFSGMLKNEFSAFKKLLLIGPPGCGKTSLVKKVVEDCNYVLLEILAPDINTSLPGETEKKLKEIFHKAKCHADINENCVILIDEIDSICMKNNDNLSSHAKRSSRQFVLLLEEIKQIDGVMVIATTNCPNEIDSHLRQSQCFDNELEIMIPTLDERVDIISKLLGFYNIGCSQEIIEEVGRWTPGFVGADLHLVVQETQNLIKKIKFAKRDLNSHLRNIFRLAVSKATPSSLRGAVGLQATKEANFSEIGGLDDVIRTLNFSVKQQFLNPEAYKRLGIPMTKGILLYGPPGCAKTTLVKALAKECNTTFLAVSAADLFSPFVGDAERLIIKLFSQARIGAPAIIFIDEIDAIVGSKSGGRERGVQERILSALLIEMDGVGVKVDSSSSLVHKLLEGDAASNSVVEKSSHFENNSGIILIGATNRPELIDDALLRPGRFDKLIYVPCPNYYQRLDILKVVTKKIPLDKSVDLKRIAESAECYSGADVKNLCVEAGLHALTVDGMSAKTIRQEHFEYVLKTNRASFDVKSLEFYESFKK